MKANRLHLLVGIAIVLVSAFEWVRAYPELPETMASNFGGDGVPGGWSSKSTFLAISAISMLFWLGALLSTPALAARARQVFTSDERVWLRDFIGWFLLASLTFSAFALHLVLEANLTSGRLSDAFVWALAVYMAYMLWWTVRLLRRTRAAARRRPS